MNALRQEDMLTTEYIENLPDGERAELIEGRIYNMAPPSRRHQELTGELYYRIADYIKSNNGGCKVYAAPFAVRLNSDEYTYVEPDISVICDESKLDERGCSGAPDWIIEVVSPASRRVDYLIKLMQYKNAGVREYWIVDPAKERVTVYGFEKETVDEYSFSDKIGVNIYDGFEIDFGTFSN